QNKHFAHYAELSQEIASTPQQKLRAFFLIDQALRRKDDDNLRRAAARLAVELGRFRESLYKDALVHLDELKKRSKDAKDDQELLHLEARALAGSRKNEQAAEVYKGLTQHDQGCKNVRAWEERLALDRDVLKNVPGCDAVADQMVFVNKESIEAHQVAA